MQAIKTAFTMDPVQASEVQAPFVRHLSKSGVALQNTNKRQVKGAEVNICIN